MKPDLFRSKTFSCFEILKNTIEPVLLVNKPADRIVASYFKANRKYGSTDRKFLYEVVFSFFRWLGWTRFLLKEDDCQIKKHFANIKDRELLTLILASSLLDSAIGNEIILYWMDELGIEHCFLKEFKLAASLREKLAVFKKFLNLLSVNKEIKISHLIPEWVLENIPESADRDKLIESFQNRPPIWLRLQTDDTAAFESELKRNNVKYAFHSFIKNAVSIIESEKSLYNYESFERGYFEIQDIASQIIGIAANPKPGERWWDCCAGGGGKTLQLAHLMKNKGRIIASDIREYKLDDLKRRARRDGFYNIECRPWDGSLLRKKKNDSFDGVLIDAPCSCSGTWRRNPDAKWHLDVSEVEEINVIQKKLIRNAAPSVKSGGVLIYATCSFFEKENLSLVNEFLSESPEFKLDTFTNPLDGCHTQGYLQVYPWDADCDAMFVARLRKG